MRKLLLLLALCVAAQAHAGDIYVPAERFAVSTGTTQCSKGRYAGADYNHEYVRCTDAGADSVAFTAEIEFPNDAGNSWTYQIEYDVGTANGICAWTIRAMALVASGDGTSAMSGTTTSVSADHDVFTDVRNRTDVSSAATVYNKSATADCTGTDCKRYRTRIEVALDRGTTTATTCDFVNLNIYY